MSRESRPVFARKRERMWRRCSDPSCSSRCSSVSANPASAARGVRPRQELRDRDLGQLVEVAPGEVAGHGVRVDAGSVVVEERDGIQRVIEQGSKPRPPRSEFGDVLVDRDEVADAAVSVEDRRPQPRVEPLVPNPRPQHLRCLTDDIVRPVAAHAGEGGVPLVDHPRCRVSTTRCTSRCALSPIPPARVASFATYRRGYGAAISLGRATVGFGRQPLKTARSRRACCLVVPLGEWAGPGRAEDIALVGHPVTN
jgi:hypothetical protein